MNDYGSLNTSYDDAEIDKENWPAPKLTNKFVFQNAMSVAEYKADIHWAKTLLLGMLAGCYISIGALLAIVVAGGCPGLELEYKGLQKLLFGMVFPVGLMLVTVSGAELVTSSLALLPAAWIERRISIIGLMKNWGVSYFGNFVGCIFLAFVAINSHIISDDPWKTYVIDLVWAKTHLAFPQAFARGFLCNWLVCLAVYNTNAANDIVGKTLAIWPCIMAFAAIGFEHSVANMFILPLGWALGAEVDAYHIFINNILPVTFGNMVGAIGMVAVTYAVIYGRTSNRISDVWNKYL